jgi:glyoxylate utilization-related uncharacterized protein
MRAPATVSYQALLDALCARPLSGRTVEEVNYIVELAENLCKLKRETDQAANQFNFQ